MKMKLLAVTALASSMVITGCATTGGPVVNDQTKKAGIGALAGALGGAAISKATGGEKTGRDAAIGAVLGAGVGAYMGRQAKQIEQQMAGTGVEVRQDSQGNINLVMPGNITFAHDDATISSSFYNSLNQLAQTMIQYDQTTIVVAGHTDSTGTASYNQALSQRRAAAVSNYLVSRGVPAHRIRTVGYGQTQPIASHANESGRSQNRRVELTINAPQELR